APRQRLSPGRGYLERLQPVPLRPEQAAGSLDVAVDRGLALELIEPRLGHGAALDDPAIWHERDLDRGPVLIVRDGPEPAVAAGREGDVCHRRNPGCVGVF